MSGGRLRIARRDVLCVLALTGICAAVLLPVLGWPPFIPPFNQDNLDALRIAAREDPSFFIEGTQNFVYRPLTYTSLWVQTEVFGLRPSVLFSTNLVIWWGCALVLYGLVRTHVRSSLVALVAGVALLTDHRVETALVWIIERQSILACLFGGSALAIAYRLPSGGRARGLGAVAVCLLLAAAMFSKEYGAAFVAATVAAALVGRPELRAWLVGASLAAVAAYASIRWLVPEIVGYTARASTTGSGSPGSGYCEEMGLLWDQREICYGQIGLAQRLVQHVWNVGATLVGTAYPYLFGGQGNLISPDLSRPVLSLVYPTMVLGLAVTAWVKRPRASLPFLVLLLANAGLNYMLFRPRNQLIGAMGLYGSAAMGLEPAAAAVAERLTVTLKRLGRPLEAGSRKTWESASAASPVVAAVFAAGLAAWGIGHEAENLQSSIDQDRSDVVAQPCVFASRRSVGPQVRRLLEEMPATARCRSRERAESSR